MSSRSNLDLQMGALELAQDPENYHLDDVSDWDVCDNFEIERLFPNSETISENIIAKNKYLLQITATSGSCPNVAIAISDNTCGVYSLNQNQVGKITSLTEHTSKIIDCRFSQGNSNLLYTGSNDGTIKLWDIRTPKKSAVNFTDTTVENVNEKKQISCFDISSNDRLLTAGTDLIEGDAFLLFWDTRKCALLGGYWESHTDDITQVRFHPSNVNKLMSGSTDGLINIYDISQSNEEDALIDTLNTESSIEQLLWFSENGKDNISCITQDAELQLWNVDGVEPYKHITRTDISKEIKRKSESHIYIERSHKAKTSLLILVGSNFRDGEIIRGLKVTEGQIYPSVGFKENKQRIRSSWYNEHTNILFTGGEKGILNVWQVDHK